MKRELLLRSKEYVTPGIQLKLLNLIEDYMSENKLNRSQLAKKLGVDKSYISQLFNVSYDHKISKLVELALSCNAMPLVFFVNMDKFISADAADKVFEIFPMQRPQNIIFKEQETNQGEGQYKSTKFNMVAEKREAISINAFSFSS